LDADVRRARRHLVDRVEARVVVIRIMVCQTGTVDPEQVLARAELRDEIEDALVRLVIVMPAFLDVGDDQLVGLRP
jgi:hypothetical protein